uniref:Putative secreted protein n=1 Tax=Anopheles marajoara TaxID=58244 RepID=A0A2M4C737_9DIPT
MSVCVVRVFSALFFSSASASLQARRIPWSEFIALPWPWVCDEQRPLHYPLRKERMRRPVMVLGLTIFVSKTGYHLSGWTTVDVTHRCRLQTHSNVRSNNGEGLKNWIKSNNVTTNVSRAIVVEV